MVLSRRSVVVGGVALGLGLAFPVRSLAAARRPTVERITVRVPGLDPAHDGLRLAQLSDLHAGYRTSSALIRAAIEEANALAPDAVLLTGDYVCSEAREVGLARELMVGLRAPA